MANFEKYGILVDRVAAYNMLLLSGKLDGLELAADDITTAHKAAKEEALENRMSELTALPPAECVREFFANTKYDCPHVRKQDDGTKVVTTIEQTIYYPALDEAYWNANKAWLSSRKGKGYPLMVAIIMDNYARGQAAATGRTEYNLPILDDKAKALKSKLVAVNPDWAGVSKTKIEVQINDLITAILPEGFELEAPLRNADRRFLLESVVTCDKKNRRYNTASVNAFFNELIGAINAAAVKWVYEYKSNVKGWKNGVTGKALVKSKADKTAEEKPAETAPEEQTAVEETAA